MTEIEITQELWGRVRDRIPQWATRQQYREWFRTQGIEIRTAGSDGRWLAFQVEDPLWFYLKYT